jgi:hypothetical protein
VIASMYHDILFFVMFFVCRCWRIIVIASMYHDILFYLCYVLRVSILENNCDEADEQEVML